MSGHGMKMDTPEAGKNEDASADHASMNHAAMDHAAMGHAAPGNASMQMDHSMHGASGANAMVSHPASETGNPAVDMQTMTPSRALDDPGIGLRGNGRKVLTYADLKSAFEIGRESCRGRVCRYG